MNMSIDGAQQLTRSDVDQVLHSDIRSRFREHFPDLIDQFLDESERASTSLQGFAQAASPDRRAAWCESFLPAAHDSSTTSCRLLISGLMIPAAALIRHYAEATALGLLCSLHDINVVERLEEDTFPFESAVELVLSLRRDDLLRIDPEGWEAFGIIANWYDEYAHPATRSVVRRMTREAPGWPIPGGDLDPGKLPEYKAELETRVSSMIRLQLLTATVEQNVKTARTRRAIGEPHGLRVNLGPYRRRRRVVKRK